MSIFARLNAGVVAELFTPPAGVAIADCFAPGLTWVDVTAQAPAVQPGWSATLTGGVWVFAAPPGASAPTLPQQATAMLAAGIAIVSTATPALNATYPVTTAAWQQMTGILSSIAVGLGLPEDGNTVNWPDVTGTPHQFTETNFKNLARAVRDFTYTLSSIQGGAALPLPTLPVTIA